MNTSVTPLNPNQASLEPSRLRKVAELAGRILRVVSKHSSRLLALVGAGSVWGLQLSRSVSDFHFGECRGKNQMKTVKAARIHNYGGSEAVRVEQVSLPEPRSGELVIRVHAAGVNPIDWKIRGGLLQQMMPLQLPFTLGGDFSGVVEALGPGVDNFKVGDEVYGQAPDFMGGSGSFAEAVLARTTHNIAAKPRSVEHMEAGALPLAGVCALKALTEDLGVSPGQTILIQGGAGGIGSMAIQLAKHLGAYRNNRKLQQHRIRTKFRRRHGDRLQEAKIRRRCGGGWTRCSTRSAVRSTCAHSRC